VAQEVEHLSSQQEVPQLPKKGIIFHFLTLLDVRLSKIPVSERVSVSVINSYLVYFQKLTKGILLERLS
jgi:hypothetical protein